VLFGLRDDHSSLPYAKIGRIMLQYISFMLRGGDPSLGVAELPQPAD